MGLLELFITACVPVLNMLLVTGVGSFLATDFAGILGKEARKHLNYVSGSDCHKLKWQYDQLTNYLSFMFPSLFRFSNLSTCVWIICFPQVVFYVFNPCLVSTYLAKTITMESMAKL
jgi:hypothetical protein